MNELEELVYRARQLTPEELEQFGAWLASCEAAACNARDAARDALAAKRDVGIDSGKIQVVAGTEVIRRIRSELK